MDRSTAIEALRKAKADFQSQMESCLEQAIRTDFYREFCGHRFNRETVERLAELMSESKMRGKRGESIEKPLEMVYAYLKILYLLAIFDSPAALSSCSESLADSLANERVISIPKDGQMLDSSECCGPAQANSPTAHSFCCCVGSSDGFCEPVISIPKDGQMLDSSECCGSRPRTSSFGCCETPAQLRKDDCELRNRAVMGIRDVLTGGRRSQEKTYDLDKCRTHSDLGGGDPSLVMKIREFMFRCLPIEAANFLVTNEGSTFDDFRPSGLDWSFLIMTSIEYRFGEASEETRQLMNRVRDADQKLDDPEKAAMLIKELTEPLAF